MPNIYEQFVNEKVLEFPLVQKLVLYLALLNPGIAGFTRRNTTLSLSSSKDKPITSLSSGRNKTDFILISPS